MLPTVGIAIIKRCEAGRSIRNAAIRFMIYNIWLELFESQKNTAQYERYFLHFTVKIYFPLPVSYPECLFRHWTNEI